MCFTKMHFTTVARNIRHQIDEWSEEFEKDNPKFNKQQFINACIPFGYKIKEDLYTMTKCKHNNKSFEIDECRFFCGDCNHWVNSVSEHNMNIKKD